MSEVSFDVSSYVRTYDVFSLGTIEVVLEPDVVFLANNADSKKYEIWRAGNGAPAFRYLTTSISNAFSGGDFLADCEASPDQAWIVYSRCGYNLTPQKQSVMLTDWNDVGPAVELYSETDSGPNLSLMPSWKPDGSKIVFRSKGAISAKNLVKTMDPDGTNVQTLYTGGAAVQYPLYSPDGSKIAFSEGKNVRVMNADGTGLATIHAAAGFYQIMPTMAWSPDSSSLAFVERDAIYTADVYWKKINADGTGLTTLLTIARGSGYGPSDIDPWPLPTAWFPDGSKLATSRQVPSDPDPDHILTTIAADASGYADFSPERRLSIGTLDGRPAVIGERVYFLGSDGTGLTSIRLDGSDFRTDFSEVGVSFQGFKGDTVNT